MFPRAYLHPSVHLTPSHYSVAFTFLSAFAPLPPFLCFTGERLLLRPGMMILLGKHQFKVELAEVAPIALSDSAASLSGSSSSLLSGGGAASGFAGGADVRRRMQHLVAQEKESDGQVVTPAASRRARQGTRLSAAGGGDEYDSGVDSDDDRLVQQAKADASNAMSDDEDGVYAGRPIKAEAKEPTGADGETKASSWAGATFKTGVSSSWMGNSRPAQVEDGHAQPQQVCSIVVESLITRNSR